MADIIKDFYRLDITRTVENLVDRGSKLKFNLFRSIVAHKEINKNIIDDYLGDIGAFLDTWTEYADDIEDAMKDCEAQTGVHTLDYDDVKVFLYGKYDYASVLPFADGVFQGISSGKFKTAEDINDFFEYTVNKAFKDRADTTAGLLDETLEVCGNKMKPADRTAVNLFNAVKRQGLFSPRDTKELYKAADRVLKFLCHAINDKDTIDEVSAPKIVIATINNIVEYVTYSIVAFMTKVYIVAQYARPFVTFSNRETATLVKTESVNTGLEYTTMRDTDEMMFRNIDKVVDATNAMRDFLSKIGIVECNWIRPYTHGLIDWHVPTEELTKNAFLSKLISNELREYISHQLENELACKSDQFTTYDCYTTVNKKLADMVYNKNQALSTATTPCQEIIHVFRGTEPESKTIKGYQDLAVDLAKAGLTFMSKLAVLLQNINFNRVTDDNVPGNVNKSFHFRNNAAELAKTINDLYKEIAVATLSKARDIEMQLNVLRNVQDAKVAEELTIKVPGIANSDVNLNDDLMCAVPDSTRLPVAINNLYSIPTLEYLTMYDEYIQSIPGMENDPYFEVTKISEDMNKLQAFLRGIKNAIIRFFQSTGFKAAAAWVQRNNEVLDKMRFNRQMTVKGYKRDLNIKHIDQLISKLNAFKEDDVKDQESVDKFIEGLYNLDGRNWGIYFGLYTNNESYTKAKDNEKATMYRNAVIFSGHVSMGMKEINGDAAKFEEAHSNVHTLLSSDDIHNELQIWKDNISRSDETYKSLINTDNKLESAVTSIKSKISNILQKNSQTAAQSNVNEAVEDPPKQEGAQTKSTTQVDNDKPTTDAVNSNDNSKAAVTNDQQALIKDLSNRTDLAITNLWGNILPAITAALKEQYAYIQEAYSKGTKTQ